MNHLARPVTVALVFVLGVVVGIASSTMKSDVSMFQGKNPKEAAAALLLAAESQAGSGSWERIAVARAYYLSGDKAAAEAILGKVTSGKVKGNDWIRIGRLYAEAKDWSKANEAFENALRAEPKDAEYAAEVGGWYNLQGQRDKAEELFTTSFKLKADEVWNTVNIAGSYVGVSPQ
jgi:Flp pilus assembly protein TadD